MIEVVSTVTLPEVLPLIRQYQQFYQVSDICDQRNATFFAQFNASNPQGCQFLYRQNGHVVAFATLYFSFTSTITAKVAILNDLFVAEDFRSQGIGRQLIEYCRDYAAKQGAARLQWVTAPDNHQAQRVYDAMNTKKSEWYFYTLQT